MLATAEKLSNINGIRILTSDGEQFSLPKEQRDMMCLLSDGTFYVSQSHEVNPYVLGFMERLNKSRVNFHKKSASMTFIRQVYETHGEVKSAIEGDQTDRQQEVLNMIKEAVSHKTSDIHIRNRAEVTEIFYRIHGRLKKLHEFSAAHGRAITATIYQSMCSQAEPHYMVNKRQDGRLADEWVHQCGLYGSRISTRPTESHNVMVIRLLYNSRGRNIQLTNLGFAPEQLKLIQRMISKTTGINIISGSTGSGKSTTLEVTLGQIVKEHNGEIHLLTIEDPTEYIIEGAVQTPLQPQADTPEAISIEWAKGISSSMRLDPDMVMVGEIRDVSSASAAMELALTGHGVWSTLHANDAVTVLSRLKNMRNQYQHLDVDLLTDASLITGLVHQSLVPILCDCKIQYAQIKDTLQEDVKERIEQYCDTDKIRFRNPDGCPKCKGDGTIGRSVVAEVILTNQKFMDTFKHKGKAAARNYWVNEMDGITQNKHMLRKINSGHVDPVMGEKFVCSLDHDTLTLSGE